MENDILLYPLTFYYQKIVHRDNHEQNFDHLLQIKQLLVNLHLHSLHYHAMPKLVHDQLYNIFVCYPLI